MTGILNYYISCLNKSIVFSSRASRQEFWSFLFMDFLIYQVLNILYPIAGNSGWKAPLYWFVSLVPAFAVWVRRLHDVGKSGWWVLAAKILLYAGVPISLPVVGASLLNGSNLDLGGKWAQSLHGNLSQNLGYRAAAWIVALAALVSNVYIFLVACRRGEPGSNRWGEPERR
jgi:uncharacterized membrane protein YhaH (DUF805 family)